MTFIDRLTRSAPLVMLLAGVLLLLAGAYAAGGVQTTCHRADGRVDCHMRTLRLFESWEVESQDAHDVVDAYDETTTSDSDALSSESPDRHSTSNDTVVLASRDGTKVYAFGDSAEGSGQHVSQLRAFLRDPNRKTAYLFSSDWPFAIAAVAFGGVWTLVMIFVTLRMREES